MACAAGGCSAGGSSTAAPAAPAITQLTTGESWVEISWASVRSAASYNLYYAEVPGVDVGTSMRVTDVESPFLHSGLKNGRFYFYVLTSVNSRGESSPSEEWSVRCGSGSGGGGSGSGEEYDPQWAGVEPTEVLEIDFDQGMSQQENGSLLKEVIQGLQPGQRLEIGAGVWSIASLFSIDLAGREDAPIFIAAKAGAEVTLTRPDANQNCVNAGKGGPARYVALQGLEITGGDTALKLYDCENLWIDRCHVHDCAGAGIAANSADTAFLHLTRNHIHHTRGSAEGMYLGANYSQYRMSYSTIALNHVHDTYGDQGDGIEVKQGSHGNWIVENLVHDCNYPCILVYGTDGVDFNLVERNICYGSGDNCMQVQGEAVVRNNLIVNGDYGFSSHDHQAASKNLVVVHNTIVNAGRAAHLQNWNGREGMVFANNVVYSRDADSIRFSSGSSGVTIQGNVVLGPVVGASSGFVFGEGLSDFVDLTWNASSLDARPSAFGALIGTAHSSFVVEIDLSGLVRSAPFESGCYEGF